MSDDAATPGEPGPNTSTDDSASTTDESGTADEREEPATDERSDTDARERRGGDREFDPADADEVARSLGRREIERLFAVLEAALTGSDRLDGESLDTLLSALEAAVVEPASVDSEGLDRMLALWEAVLVDAASVDEAERVLDVFEAAGVDDRRSAGVFGFLERLGLDDLLAGTSEDAARAFGGASGRGPDARGTSSHAGDDSVDAYRLARLIATVTRNATRASGRSGVRVGTELARAAATARSPAELLDEGREIALSELERLGVDTGVDPEELGREADDDRTLRERGEALLEQSADLGHEAETHPAYDHVVDQLAPDEARILRLLAAEGPQPMIDVHDLGWLPLGSTVVAKHLTMLAANAGVRHDERTPAYLHNLERLGLLWFAEEPVDDLERYRVLEAQPNVERAVEAATREKFVRRSVHLTPFGAAFCRATLPVDVVEGATGALGDVFPIE